jgi:Domain of unknown function (DUF4598)
MKKVNLVRERLRDLLPKLEAANEHLSVDDGIENVDEEEEYIEMVFSFTRRVDENLGLGVLLEREDSDDEAMEKSDSDLKSDSDGNIFDKLLRRTADPVMGQIIGSGGPGLIQSLDSDDEDPGVVKNQVIAGNDKDKNQKSGYIDKKSPSLDKGGSNSTTGVNSSRRKARNKR